MRMKLSTRAEKLAVLYLRMSSNPQKDSITQQRRECLRYAADNGYRVVGEYVDEAISGVSSKKKRLGFQQLVTDAESGKFEYVICWEQNRASRSKPREFIEEMNPLANAGVKLVMTDKGLLDLDDMGGIIQAICGANSDNEFILSLSRRVVRGQHAKALMGLHVAGPLPFGYVSKPVVDETGDVVLNKRGDPLMGKIHLGDKHDVATVQLMFSWYVEGLSFRGINARLQKTRNLHRSTKWVQSTLSHPYYVGDYRWNHNSKSKFFGIENGKVTSRTDFDETRSKDDNAIVIKDNHPAIVDRETFNRVQALRGQRASKTSPFTNGGSHMLTGLCWCAKCGSKFSGHREGGGRLLLKCNGYNNGICTGNYVRQDEVIGCIIASAQTWIKGKHLKELRVRLEEKINDKRSTIRPADAARELKAKKKEYERARQRFRELPDDLIGDFMSDLRTMKSEIDALEKELASTKVPAKAQLSEFDLQADKLLESLCQLEEAVRLVSSTKPHLVRELISAITSKVLLEVQDHGPGRNPRYELKGGQIQVNPSYNLLPASYYSSQVILNIPLVLAS